MAPLLLIPGRIAMACAIPIMMASFLETSRFPGLALLAKNNKNPVTKSMAPTNRTFPVNKFSICSSNNSPTKAAGIIEITILKLNWNSSLDLNLKRPLTI